MVLKWTRLLFGGFVVVSATAIAQIFGFALVDICGILFFGFGTIAGVVELAFVGLPDATTFGFTGSVVFAVSVEAVLYDFLLKSSDTVAQFAKLFEKNVNCCDFLKLDSQLLTEDTHSSGVFAFWI